MDRMNSRNRIFCTAPSSCVPCPSMRIRSQRKQVEILSVSANLWDVCDMFNLAQLERRARDKLSNGRSNGHNVVTARPLCARLNSLLRITRQWWGSLGYPHCAGPLPSLQ